MEGQYAQNYHSIIVTWSYLGNYISVYLSLVSRGEVRKTCRRPSIHSEPLWFINEIFQYHLVVVITQLYYHTLRSILMEDQLNFTFTPVYGAILVNGEL
jgi:hypothetical protein